MSVWCEYNSVQNFEVPTTDSRIIKSIRFGIVYFQTQTDDYIQAYFYFVIAVTILILLTLLAPSLDDTMETDSFRTATSRIFTGPSSQGLYIACAERILMQELLDV
ncbi:hypothetical protein OUZ56_030457 [Daphnia magna]|uniref:Uncharacterized protein n=1 Tax=Daphnia magna TaxID=35525 RepID=A0ABQ9ZRD1_9CRUS|nr:hypothetical protein OUZ56_030457 [Daphnia magna]